MANYREPQWLLPNEKNLAMPASDATVGSGLAEDRHSLYSMDFDGTSYIDIGSTNSLDLGTNSTISLWLKSSSGNLNNTVIGEDTYQFDYLFSIASASNEANIRIGSVVKTFTVTEINDGNWNHWCIVRSGDSIELFVNNTSKGTQTGYGTGTNTKFHVIGAEGDFQFPINGQLDEIAGWNRTLSSSEITTIYNSGVPGNLMALSDKPVAYWPLGEQARLGSEWQFPNEVLQSQVMDFDGTDYITTPSITTSGDDLTISFWAKLPNLGSGSGYILSGDANNQIYYNSSEVMYAKINGSTAYIVTNSGGVPNVFDDNWHHFAITKSGSTLTFWFDGNSHANSGSATTGGFTLSHIGSYITPSGWINGQLSNVALWDSDQTANMANIYNNGSPQSSYTITPTAWYKLNATSDYAGLNPNFHNALSFDGTAEIEIPEITLSNEFSISVWLNSDTFTAGQAMLFGGNSSNAYKIEFNGPTIINLKIAGSNTGLSGSAWDLNEWQHLLITRDSSNNVTMYRNGVSWSTTTKSGDFIFDRISGFYSSASHFDGELSNIAVYNQVISPEDVKYLYNGGTPQTNVSFEPLSWWKFDNLTTGIQDSGSASNNATNNGATEVISNVAVDQWNFDNAVQSQTPNWSSALDFNGSSGYIDLDPGVMKTFTSDNLSISCWLKADALGTYNYVYADGHTSGNKVVSLSYASVRGGLEFSVGNSTVARASGVAINTGEWYHVVCTYAAGGDLKFYLNGNTTPVATATFSGALDLAGHTVSAIGRSNIHSSYYWDGEISNVQVWNTELGTSDVTTLYNSGQPQSTASLSPKSWYKLNNTTTGIQDSGSAGVNGTNNGATEIQTNVWTPRLNGESTTLPSTALVSSDLQFESPYSNFSLDFDGTNDQVNIPDPGSFTSATSFSISFWDNPDSFASGGGHVLFDTSNSGFTESVRILYYSGTTLSFRIITGGVTSQGTLSTTQTGVWNHYVMVFDGSLTGNDRLKAYQNGSLLSLTYSGSFPASMNISEQVGIGNFATTYSNRYNGKIDELAIWNSALNQSQVSSIYNNGYPADLTSLSPSNWWRLGEDAYFVSNWTVPNKITGQPNGTSQNMTESALVADAPGSYASGVGSGLVVGDRVGDAPESTANSLSFNMTPLNKVSYPAGYTPTQVDNVYSMAFDGTNDYITAGNPTELQITGNLSLSAWVKTSMTSTGFVISKDDGSNRNYALVVVMDGGTLRARFFIVKSNTLVNVTSTTINVGDNNFHNIVGVNDGTDLKIYVDGNLEATNAGAGGTIDNDTVNLDIGRRSDNAQFFDGNIDEVAIFDYALSARQIKQDIYNGTTTGKTADLNNISNLTAPVAWYRMGD